MINTTDIHGFQKLDLTQLYEAAQNMKTIVAERRGQKAFEKQDSYDYDDYSHLSARNLESKDFIDHSAPFLKAKVVKLCGRCQGGWIITRAHQCSSPTSMMCEHCERPKRWLDRLNKLELPLDAVNMHLDVYEPDSERHQNLISDMLSYLNRTSQKPPAHLYYGPPGNGKTSLLYALAREACQLRHQVKYTTHSQIMQSIKASWNSKSVNPAEVWLDGIDMLLLDEFGGVGGSASKSQWWIQQTIELIEAMFKKWSAGKLAIVMTTNIYPAQLFQTFAHNSAFQSRILGMFTPCEMRGVDRRVQKVDLSEWGLN